MVLAVERIDKVDQFEVEIVDCADKDENTKEDKI